MKVDSLYRYRLPGRVLLEKGVSEVGELPAAAKKYLDQLISAGIVKVLAPAPAAKPAKTEEPKQAAPSRTAETEPAPAHDVSAVDVRAKTTRKKDEA